MSYCVNCGVRLDASLKKCPLCNTPVIHPNETAVPNSPSPFPSGKGQVETVKSRDLAILLSVSLGASSVVCGLLNLLVFPYSLWSLYVIGACLIIGTLALPAFIHTRFPLFGYLLLDGTAIALYQYMISFNTPGQRWFFHLALPITALCTAAALSFAALIQRLSSSFLMIGLYFFLELSLLCVGLELLIRRYTGAPLCLTWSAIVLAICGVIVICLLTILSRSRLRNAVRRRLHF